MGASSALITRASFVGVALVLAACGAADEPVDPGDLALRDLLGVAPRLAVTWDDDQRAAAREVLAGGLVEQPAETVSLAGPATHTAEHARVVTGLLDLDARRLDRDRDALGLVVIDEAGPAGAAADAVEAPLTVAAASRSARRACDRTARPASAAACASRSGPA